MIGLLCFAWFYLRGLDHRGKRRRRARRRWQRYPIDLPVRVVIPNGAGGTRAFIPARGTAVSGGGMVLYVDLALKRDDQIQVEFETPSDLRVMGTVRSHTGHCFGLEFVNPLSS